MIETGHTFYHIQPIDDDDDDDVVVLLVVSCRSSGMSMRHFMHLEVPDVRILKIVLPINVGFLDLNPG